MQKGTAHCRDRRAGRGSACRPAAAATGGYLDVANFCCPEYLGTMLDSSSATGTAKQDAAGTTHADDSSSSATARIVDVTVEKSSGVATLDLLRSARCMLTKLPPLPAAIHEPALTVHLCFEYSAENST